MKRWLEDVRELPGEAVFVQHEPATARYGRAQSKLKYLVREGIELGERDAEFSGALEVAGWAPAPTGRGAGYYFCFRLFLEDAVVSLAVLFCFYDGTEKSPGFRSHEAAAEYARSHGFEVK